MELNVKKTVLLAFVLMLFPTAVIVMLVIPVLSNPTESLMETNLPVHNIDSGLNFSTIEGAIKDDETLDGHTILVDTGIYHEHVVVDKSVLLVGENRNNTIIDGRGTGIGIYVVTDNVKVFGFTVTQCNNGIALGNSSNSMLNGNIVTDCVWGILLFNSGGNILKDNNMRGNDFNFGVGGKQVSFSDMINDIDTSNTVDGKPIYYLINQHNLTIDSSTSPEPGYLAFINSTNIRVENLNLTHNRHGVLLFHVINATIQNVVTSNNQRGITLSNSANCTIMKSTCVNNDVGIEIFYSQNVVATENSITNTLANEEGFMLFSSENCKVSQNVVENTWNSTYLLYSNNTEISENNITRNLYGVILGYSNNNVVTGNNIIENDCGIEITLSSNNSICHNNFVNNTEQADIRMSNYTNFWDDRDRKGNYWSDYENRYPNATEIEGIWDTPYVIDENNQDNYPIIPEFPTWTAMLLLFVILAVTIAICKRRLLKAPIP